MSRSIDRAGRRHRSPVTETAGFVSARPTQTDASGPSHGGASGSRGRRARTSSRGNRGDAYACARWAGRSASRGRMRRNVAEQGRLGGSVSKRSYTEFSTDERAGSCMKYVYATPFVHRCGGRCGSRESAANEGVFIPTFHPLSASRHAGMLALLRRGEEWCDARGAVNRADG